MCKISGRTLEYAGRGRLWHDIAARYNTTTYPYNDDDQVASVTQPEPDGGGLLAAPVTETYYDSAGRKDHEILPDGGRVDYLWYPTGQLQKTWGTRTYPVSYTYDAQGRVKTLKTLQGVEGEGEAITNWNYSPISGQLLSQQYQDGKGSTYTPAGRMLTRTWARGLVTA